MPLPTSASRTTEYVEYSRFDGLPGLEVMSARWVEHAFAPHMHDFYAVSLNCDGCGAFDCRGESRTAAPGTCNLIAPGEMHTGYATSRNGWAYRNLYIDAALMATLLDGLEWIGSRDVAFKSPLTTDDVLVERLTRAFAKFQASDSLLEQESLLLDAAARLATTHFVEARGLRDAGREHGAVPRVKDWLESHCEQNVSIHSLARLVDLSPYYLIRAFHAQVGLPPHKYQMMIRVNEARKLLRKGTPISDVAYRTGFCDQSHLTRCFKRILGVTPARYAAVG